jgi:hypothetical protein
VLNCEQRFPFSVFPSGLTVTGLSRIDCVVFMGAMTDVFDSLCGLVVRVLGYRSRGPGFDSRALPEKKISSGSGTGSTQPREYN